MKTAVRVLAVVLLVALLAPALAAACPLCKEAASNADTPGQGNMWRGMYWSILLMVAMPFMMVGGMILAVRRARRRREGSLPQPPAPMPFPDARGARP
jgi:heme/copper-type cytochrome/quinol oxidase subunit 2